MPSRVLIAEEQKECCQLFKQYLQRCGYEVATVHDGMSCIEALNNGESPDVLILSWELPWGEGEGVLDWLQYQGMENIAVVVLTARMDADARQKELALPRVMWLQRPFRLVELLHAVQSRERTPRNCWRCLESLWRKTADPAIGVLFDSAATTMDPVEPDVEGPAELANDDSPAGSRYGQRCRIVEGSPVPADCLPFAASN